MTEVVMDSQVLNEVLEEINRVMKDSRSELDKIIENSKNSDTYEDLINSKDLMRLYGKCADDYARLSYLQTGVSESMMDLRRVRRKMISESSLIAPSVLKKYKTRIDVMIEDLSLFKEAIQSARQGMESRVRYFNSCAYTSYDKIIGAKC